MANRTVNNIKLGVFVIAGLLFLIMLLYMIGKKRNLFGSTYELKAHFDNVQGLIQGNNVRFAGLQAGTVKSTKIINDTLVEVTLAMEQKMKNIVRKNALVSIGTEGLVGNKVVNIFPSGQLSAYAVEGDVLISKKTVDPDEMLRTFAKTNSDISQIADELKYTIHRINNSPALWDLLNESSLAVNLKSSLSNISKASANADKMMADLRSLIIDVKAGEGSIGTLLTDTSFAYNLNEAVTKIKTVGDKADLLADELNKMVQEVQYDVNNGKGAVNTLLKDSTITTQLKKTLTNIEAGTAAFDENMEALKHNFLFRNYFKKMERQKKKDAEKNKADTGN